MNRIVLYLASGIFMAGASAQTTNNNIKTYLDSLSDHTFSGTVLVAQNDSIVYEKAYGLASIEYEVPNTLQTKFNIASITKLFTAVATLQLYEQGKINLHAPLGKYLPDYPNEKVRNEVTVHQLLTHTSGLNNFYVNDVENINNSGFQKVADFVPLFVNDTLLSSPGTKYDYSASGYVLLGLVIEIISGDNYYNYLSKNIFKPASMESTIAIPVDSIVKNKASGYTSQFGESEILKKNDYYLTMASPAGFYYATAKDLFRFSKAIRNHSLLTEQTTNLMLESKVKGYNTFLGYGIDIDTSYNQTIVGITGGWYGIHCELLDFTETGHTVVILSNIDDGGDTGATIVADFFKSLLATEAEKE